MDCVVKLFGYFAGLCQTFVKPFFVPFAVAGVKSFLTRLIQAMGMLLFDLEYFFNRNLLGAIRMSHYYNQREEFSETVFSLRLSYRIMLTITNKDPIGRCCMTNNPRQ